MANINISQILMKRGNTAAAGSYVGPLGELLVDTGLKTVRIQDGVTPGGMAVLVTLTGLNQINSNIANLQAAVNTITGIDATFVANINTLLSNAASQYGDITTLYANAEVQSVAIRNLQSFQTYANLTFGTSSYGNADVAAYLISNPQGSTYSNANVAGYLLTSSIITDINANVTSANAQITNLWANATTQALGISTLQGQVYADANVASYLPTSTIITGINANITAANAAITSLTSNAAIQASLLDTLTGNAASQSTLLDTLTSNAATQATTLTTLLGNAVTQQTSLIDLVANAAAQAQAIANSAGTYGNSNVVALLGDFGNNSILTTGTANIGSLNMSSQITWGGGSQVYEDTALVAQGAVAVALTSPGDTTITAGTNTWTFGTDGAISTTDPLVINVPNGVPTSVSNWNGQGGWNQGFYSDLATTGGSGTGLTVDVAANGGGYISINQITIHTPGTGYTNGDVITITNEYSLSSTFTIGVAGQNSWGFGTDGNLVLPDTGHINYANGTSILSGIGGSSSLGGFAAYYNSLYTTNNDDLYIAPLWDSGPGPAYLKLPGYPNSTGNAVVLSNYQEGGAGVSIISSNPRNGNTEYVWNFGSNGELSLPTGGNIGATKGGTMLDAGFGYNTSLTSFYSSGMYSSCVTANSDGTLYITTYGDGTGTSGLWTFSGANLILPENGTIKPYNASNANQILKLVPTSSEAGDHIHLTSGDLSTTSIFLGNDYYYVRTRADGAMVIGTDDSYPDQEGYGYRWTFGNTGATTFPDQQPVTISGNLTVGNLTVNGTSTTINTVSYSVEDNIIQIAADNPADTLDIGFVGHRTVGGQLEHTGFVRNASTNNWMLFSNVIPQPGTTVNFTNAVLDDLQLGNISAGHIALTGNTYFNSGIVGSVQTATGIDVYAPAGADWAQLNYDNQNFVATTSNGIQIDVGTDTWIFSNTGVATLGFPDGSLQTTAYTGSTYGNANVIANLQNLTTNVTTTGNVTAGKFIGDGTGLTGVALKTTGSWTLSPGANTVSFTVAPGRSYSMWVNGNIPNGIVMWNATVTLANTNVPAMGTQYGWYYVAGNALVLTSIPNQIVGTAGGIVTTAYGGSTSNVFTFGITNNSGSSQTVYWGYVTLS